MNFRLLAAGVDVAGVNAELAAHPELWGSFPLRTADPDSPHQGVPDIWLRWRARASQADDGRASYVGPHFPVFWPAWNLLPSLHPIVRNLSHLVDAVHLGGILITKVPPGGRVRPHVDRGWSAEYFDTKLYLVLASNARCLNACGGDVEHFRAGDVWTYPNSIMHGVENNGDTDRVNVIICFRTSSHDNLCQASGPAGQD